MNNHSIFLYLFVALLFVSCKTTEEARKERLVNDLSVKMEESKRAAAESETRSHENLKKIEDLETQFLQFTSDLEVLKADLIQSNKDKIELIEEEIKNIKEKLEQQESFIKEVLQTLKKMGAKAKTRTSSNSKNADPFDHAFKLFSKRYYTKSMPMFIELLNSGKLNAIKTNKALYALGVISYSKKKYENSITYLSKIITKYPRSSLAPESYLYIGKSLDKLGKKDEAKESFKIILEKYPKSREVKEAKKLLN